VLVELDSADLRSKIIQQEITFGSTAASLIDAQQAYDIQLNQNLSDVKAAEQKVTFARMDFDKYLGDKAAAEILARLGVQSSGTNELSLNEAPTTGRSLTNAVVSSTNVASAQPSASASVPPPVDFSRYADKELLGDGEAKQKLRELEDAVQIAQKELQQAQSTLEGTKRLFDKDFVTKIEWERDQLTYDNSVLKVKKAETALNLFAKYEFRKSAQEALSKYTESLREMDRTSKGAISKLAQADAKLKSAQAKYAMEEKQLKELNEQLGKCVLTASKPGLVVYGSGGEARYWRDEEQIREGATVREGQTVLTIPDLRKTCIKVKIHESYIKKIQKGQKVHITADAFPDRQLEGEISNVGVLPDSENSWLNPDMKVYRTTISIHGQNDWIRPGMSTKVQIVVNQLADVVHIPIQAVTPLEDKKVCYVVAGGRLEQREVEVGEFNDEFIEIKKGIQDGERVCLRSPAGAEERGAEKKVLPAKEPSKPENKAAVTAAALGGTTLK
jgi:HlyD family secretion protein